MKSPSRYTLILCSLLWSVCCIADERILNYHSDIQIHPDGSMTVSENIRVRAEGKQIRRGIYRDFPTSYKDRFGNFYRVDFDVESVLRNNTVESWHSEARFNGVRVYVGNANRMLDAGVHSYTIRYRSNRQLGFFDQYDELYWNVTGNGWGFPIDAASATVTLPFSVAASEFQLSGYVGHSGSTESNVLTGIIDGSKVEFASKRMLAQYEGLTIVAAWPKGLIAEPRLTQKLAWFVKDNGAALVLLIGFILPFIIYFRFWDRVGRDPRKGIIIPRFKPPSGLSPAACRYVMDMGLRQSAFTAAIINLAIKGHLQIRENDSEFTLKRLKEKAKAEPTAGEAVVLKALLPHATSSITLENSNHKDFQTAKSALNTELKKEYMGRLFHLNTRFLVPPLLISIVAAISATAFEAGTPVWIIWCVLTVFMHALFIFLLRAPTPAGRQIMDEIEGFKMYLNTAEQSRLDRMKSPTLTPEVFESFLPYAYALSVENQWCERFSHELPEEVREKSGYEPSWYTGNFNRGNSLRHLSSNFSSSFSSAISSASTAPGSSSGGGGGGSSGGGGGGGGGGGW